MGSSNIFGIEMLFVGPLGMRLRIGGIEGARGVMMVAFLRLSG